MSANRLTIGLPSARTDSTPLALTELVSCALTKNGNPLQTFNAPFVSGSIGFDDTSPDAAQTDSYSATVKDTEGNVSAAAVVTINVPAKAPPNAPSISGMFIP